MHIKWKSELTSTEEMAFQCVWIKTADCVNTGMAIDKELKGFETRALRYRYLEHPIYLKVEPESKIEKKNRDATQPCQT